MAIPGVQPFGPIDDLLVAVGGRDEQVRDVISKAGAARVADIAVSEIRTRWRPPRDAEESAINLFLTHGDEQFEYALAFNGHDLSVGSGVTEKALADIRYSLVDLIRLLYSARAGYRSTSREVQVREWPWNNHDSERDRARLVDLIKQGKVDPERIASRGVEQMALIYRSVQSVLGACSSDITGLTELAAHYGTDKWGGLHWFTPHYEKHFGPMRYDPVRVLEIGIGGFNFPALGGESLRMWQRYFPRGLIYGLDIFDKSVSGPRIRTIKGSQNDPELLRALGEELGPFDIVIDDGSHHNEHVRTSFEALFGYVRPGGFYVIEDLHTSYWPRLGGEAPPGSPRTSIGMIKDLLDQIHFREFADVDDEQARSATHPSEVFVYHNLAFLGKGVNSENGIPAYAQEGLPVFDEGV